MMLIPWIEEKNNWTQLDSTQYDWAGVTVWFPDALLLSPALVCSWPGFCVGGSRGLAHPSPSISSCGQLPKGNTSLCAPSAEDFPRQPSQCRPSTFLPPRCIRSPCSALKAFISAGCGLTRDCWLAWCLIPPAWRARPRRAATTYHHLSHA